jgi:hypothetical protein
MKRFIVAITAGLLASGANHAFAQQTIPSGNYVVTQWGFNLVGSSVSALASGTGTYNNHAASGVGGTTGVGSGVALLLSGSFPANAFGALNDNTVAATSNGYVTMNNANPTDASGQGVEWHVSTAAKTNIAFALDILPGSRTSKYWQVYYTSDGATWQPAPAGGTGGSVSSTNGTAITMSSSGLATITSIPAGIVSSGSGTANPLNQVGNWVNGLSYEFPVGGAWENNPNFGVGLFQIHNPFQTNTAATDYGFVSALAGTNSTDTTTGYIRGSATGGTQRFDMVTVSAVPEPTSLALLSVAGLFCRRSRK